MSRRSEGEEDLEKGDWAVWLHPPVELGASRSWEVVSGTTGQKGRTMVKNRSTRA